MSGSFKKTHERGLHPQVVARLFEIDLRTIFRLFKRGIIHSSTKKSLLADKDEVLLALFLKYISLSLKDSANRLEVTKNTILAWKKCKILKEVVVLGESRIKLASIQALKTLTNYKAGRKKVLSCTSTINGLVPIVKRAMKKLEPQIVSKAKKDVKKRLQDELCAFEKSETIKLRKSQLEFKNRQEKTQKQRRRKMFVKIMAKHDISVMFKKKPFGILTESEIYRPNGPEEEREMGSRRLVTIPVTLKFLNVHPCTLEKMHIRSCVVVGQKLFFAQSVEACKSRQSKMK